MIYKKILYINNISALHVYRSVIIIHTHSLHVEINQRKKKVFILHINIHFMIFIVLINLVTNSDALYNSILHINLLIVNYISNLYVHHFAYFEL